MTYCYIHHCTHNTHTTLPSSSLSLPPDPQPGQKNNKISARAPHISEGLAIIPISLILIRPNKIINQSSNLKL